jgi:hypothetical protein
MLRNGNFMEGWETLDPLPEANFLRNQRPRGWQLAWLKPGTPLYDDPNTRATGIPECVHKLSTQLPPDEQRGQPKALILDGDTTYKIFSATAPFGATLSQTVTGLEPGSEATLTVPIQTHLHGDPDPHGAEAGVWVNGEGGWVNGATMGDRKWHEHVVRFDVPPSGTAEIVIRVKSKWARPKDFFFDGITLTAETAVTPPPPPIAPPGQQTIIIQLPPGLQISQGVSSQAGIVEVNVPEGVTIQIV